MDQLPLWSLKEIYADFTSAEYTHDMQLLLETCKRLDEKLKTNPESEDRAASWLVEAVNDYNRIMATYENLEAYAYTRFSTNTRDEAAVKGLNQVEEIALTVKAVDVTMKNRLSEVVGEKLDAILPKEPILASYRFVLEEMLKEQQHMMGEAEESLAADLGRSGGDAWGRLQEAISSTASTVWDEESGEEKTVIALRALAYDSDRAVREKAFKKELQIWKQHEIPLAFALNGVKGTTIALNRRRSYESSLEKSIHQARITRKTLDSLIQAMEESLPMFREYLELKAGALGVDTLAFYDIFAPISTKAKVWTFEEAKSFIIENFTDFHPGMGAFAKMAFDSAWIDARPRDGKVGGAYCISFPLQKQTRVLCNFDGSLSAVSTVAHELGHAYHSYVLKDEPALIAEYPMTLAETASIFAETIIFTSALKQADTEERVLIMETFLQESTQVIVDILSRFYFERELFSRRADAELMPDVLCGMMQDAQLKTYGSALDSEQLHPYMWAVKGHYYSTGLSFYNFPYAFGQLFGLGLYAKYQQEGPEFRHTYDDLLLKTGRESAVDVTKSAGFSIETPDFWRSGIDVIRQFKDDFKKALKK